MTDFEAMSNGNVRCAKHGVTFSENELKQVGTTFVAPCGCKMLPYGSPLKSLQDAINRIRRGGGGSSA